MPNYVNLNCKYCLTDFKVLFKQRKRKFCSRNCVNLSQAGEGNPAFGKTYNTKIKNPKWAESISKSCKGLNSGDKNGMKSMEARIKVSKARKKIFENPETRKEVSKKVAKAWKEGKFNGVKTGRCKWYFYQKLDGSTIKVQGTWELAFAKWADFQNLNFVCHKSRIKYLDGDGNEKSYYPDFYVFEWDCWVDIKNDYHFNLQKDKFDLIRKSNPNLKLRIVTKKDLIDLGVVLGK